MEGWVNGWWIGGEGGLLIGRVGGEGGRVKGVAVIEVPLPLFSLLPLCTRFLLILILLCKDLHPKSPRYNFNQYPPV